jgi:hypothetical protein
MKISQSLALTRHISWAACERGMYVYNWSVTRCLENCTKSMSIEGTCRLLESLMELPGISLMTCPYKGCYMYYCYGCLEWHVQRRDRFKSVGCLCCCDSGKFLRGEGRRGLGFERKNGYPEMMPI